MNLMPKISWLLLIFALFRLLIGVWALIESGESGVASSQLAEVARERRGQQSFKWQRSVKNDEDYDDYDDVEGDDDRWDTRPQAHQINIQMTNVDEEEQKESEKDRAVQQALIQMTKLRESKMTKRQENRINSVPQLDFRREFASDEANPYI